MQTQKDLSLIDPKTFYLNRNKTQPLSYQGEAFVASLLQEQGYSIKAMNYRIRGGELDIVACKDSEIIFVEVKTRMHDYFNLSEVITKAKKRVIIRTAKYFLLKHHLNFQIIRFDVALVHHGKPVHYIVNAFCKDDLYEL